MFRMVHVFLLLTGVLLVPGAAWAQATLTCIGPTPTGQLFDTTTVCAFQGTLHHIFSNVVCYFLEILNEIMGIMYCGMQDALTDILATVLLLYLIISGMMIVGGMIAPNAKELLVRVLKLTVVWVFATSSAWGIGIAFNFLLGAANSGVGWVLAIVAPILGLSAESALLFMDALLYSILTGPFSSAGGKLTGFITILFFVLPPVFALFMYLFVQSALLLIRAVMSYLLGMSVIAFLITLSPIFLSFMLFQSTFHLFETWLKQIMAFCVQIILIFAALALWIVVISGFVSFFGDLTNIIFPYRNVLWLENVRNPWDSWGYCDYTIFPTLSCISPNINHPSLLETEDMLIFLIVYNLVTLVVVGYAFDALIRDIPRLIQGLAGGGLGGALPGGHGPGSFMPQSFRNIEIFRDSGGSGLRQMLFGGGRAGAAETAADALARGWGAAATPMGAVSQFLRQQGALATRGRGGYARDVSEEVAAPASSAETASYDYTRTGMLRRTEAAVDALMAQHPDKVAQHASGERNHTSFFTEGAFSSIGNSLSRPEIEEIVRRKLSLA